MNKIKLFIASMLGAIALVFACVLGTRVNAAVSAPENGTYTVTASDIYGGVAPTVNYKASSKSSAALTLVHHNFITLSSGTNYYENLNVSDISVDANSTYTKTSTSYGVRMGGGRTFTLTLAANQTASIQMVGYSSAGGKKIKVGDSSGTELYNFASSAKIYDITLDYTFNSSNNVLYLEGSASLVSMTVTVSSLASYDVTFNSMGGSAVTAQKVVTGGYATKPSNPTYAGHKFLGWFTSTDGGTTLSDTEFSFTNTSITAALTLYAKWEEVATHNITFKKYSTDTTEYAIVSNIADGDSVGTTNWPANPRILNKTFVGWYDGDTAYTSSTSITSDKLLVAKFTELKNDLVVFGDYTTGLSTTSSADEHNFVDGVDASGSSNKKTGSKSYTIGDVAFNGTANSSTFVQCGELTFTLTKTSMVTFYGTQTNDSNAQTTYVVDTTSNETVMSSFVVSTKVSDTSAKRESFSVTLPAGTYKTVQSGLLNWYGIRVNQDIIAADVSLSFDKQFDKDGSAATKLRFIGTIEGLATTEYTKIESITFTFDFNGEDDRALSVTQLYLSITGYDQYAAASNKMYFVYQLDNINKTTYAGLKLTDCKLTVVFTDGSSKTETHADIELPATFDNYVA